MRRSLMGWILVAVALLAIPAEVCAEEPPPSDKPQGEQLDEAHQHFEIALRHYAEGRYREAIIELRRAHALDPSGKDLLYNLAVVHEKLGEVGPALDYYRQVHRLEKDGPDKDRIAATITRLEGARDELIRTRLAERGVQENEPMPEPESSASDAVLWVSAGVAVVAVAVSAVFGARALSLRPGPSSGTGGGRDVSDVRRDARTAHRSAIVADVSLLVGLVSGGTAGVLYLGRSEPADQDPLGALDEPSAPTARFGLDVGIRF